MNLDIEEWTQIGKKFRNSRQDGHYQQRQMVKAGSVGASVCVCV